MSLTESEFADEVARHVERHRSLISPLTDLSKITQAVACEFRKLEHLHSVIGQNAPPQQILRRLTSLIATAAMATQDMGYVGPDPQLDRTPEERAAYYIRNEEMDERTDTPSN